MTVETNQPRQPGNGYLEDEAPINWRLLLLITWGNRLLILLVLALAIAVGFLIVRYSTQVFETKADIQFTDQSKKQSIDLGAFVNSGNLDKLTEEMMQIESRGYKIKALEALPIQVSYYGVGRVKVADLYTTSPYRVEAEILDSSIIGAKIYIEKEEAGNYSLRFEWKGAEEQFTFAFGREYSTPPFNIRVTLTDTAGKDRDSWPKSYFVLNDTKQYAWDLIEDNLKIEVDNAYGGRIFVRYKDINRQRAIDVTNTITKAIVDNGFKRKSESASLTIEFIQQQIDSLENALYQQENVMKEFKRDNQLISPSIAEQTLMEKFKELDAQKLDVLMEDKSLGWLLDYANNKVNDLEALSGYFGDLKFNNFTPYFNSLTELQKQHDALSLSVAPGDPRLKLVTQQIEEIKKNFREALINAKDKLNVRKQYLAEQEQKYQAQFLMLPEQESEFMRLSRLTDIKEKYYLLLLEKQSEFEITLAGMISDYLVLDKADETVLVAPNRIQVWGIALMAGMLLSFGFVYLKYITHDKILGLPDVEGRTAIPILGVLPHYRKERMLTPAVVVSMDPKSMISEVFRVLRTNIGQRLNGYKEGGKTIAITSTVSGEGKTFTGVNIAQIITFLGKKVIVIDFDLRKPKIAKALGVPNHRGISNILRGENTVEECILSDTEHHFDVIPSGPVPPNPAELLVSDEAMAVIEKLRSMYDVVVIDNSPVGLVSDVIPILPQLDLTIFILRANYSHYGFINTLNHLRRANQIDNLAIVINDIGGGSMYGRYGYRYGYGINYGYSYGYGYGLYDEDTPQKTSLWKRIAQKLFGGR